MTPVLVLDVPDRAQLMRGGRVNNWKAARCVHGKPRTYSTRSFDAWRDYVAIKSREEWRGRDPLWGPVAVHLEIRAAAFAKCRRPWGEGIAILDVDSMWKSTLDALAQGGIYHDDLQVTQTAAEKTNRGAPGLGITVFQLLPPAERITGH